MKRRGARAHRLRRRRMMSMMVLLLALVLAGNAATHGETPREGLSCASHVTARMKGDCDSSRSFARNPRAFEEDDWSQVYSSVDDICSAAREAVHRRAYQGTTIVGGSVAREPFTEFPANGGVLIGFRIWKDQFVGSPVIGAYQAIYLTASGEEHSGYRNALGEPVIVKARPGYAVGAIRIRGGGGMDDDHAHIHEDPW